MNALGELLRNRRDVLRSRGVTVAQIEDRSGLPQSTIYEHLRRTAPFETMPRRRTLEKLAKGFQLGVDELVEAAKLSYGSQGDPLQLLLRAAQVETGRSVRQAVRKAKQEGHALSEGTVSAMLTAQHGQISDAILRAVAAGFDLPFTAVRDAYVSSSAKRRYRLPPHIEEQMTPQRWAKIMKIVEDILTVE